MGYLVKYKGLNVICDTPQDIEALAEHEAVGRKRAIRQENVRHRSITKLVGEIGEKQREFLFFLSKHAAQVKDSEIQQELALPGNKALAGVLSGISKRAKTVGIDKEIIVKSMQRNGSGERHYRYGINDNAREEIMAGLLAIELTV